MPPGQFFQDSDTTYRRISAFAKRSRSILNKVLMKNPNQNNFQTDPIIRLKKLPFDFKEGACNTFTDKNETEFALLCFDREDPTTCYICSDLENCKTLKYNICSDPENCKTLKSVPTRQATRNAIQLGSYQGRIQMLIDKFYRVLLFIM